MLTLGPARDEAAARHHHGVAVHVVHVRVHRVLERDLPVAPPVHLAGLHERIVVEELLGNVLLDGRGIVAADPHEDHALERARGIDLGLGARLAAHAGVRALGEHRHVLAGLVVDPAVVRTGHGPAIVAIALAQACAAVRAHVLDGRDRTSGAAEETDLLAQQGDLHRFARAHLAVFDRRVPVVAQAKLGNERPDLAAELGDGAVRARGGCGGCRSRCRHGWRHGLYTAKHLLELNDHVSTNSHSSGLRPSASIAPASMYQLSISCWPELSMSASGRCRQVS